MSEETLAIIRRAYDGFRTMDYTAILDALDPEVEWDANEALLHRGVYHGHDGVREYLARLDEAWGDFHIDAQDFNDSVAGYAMVSGRLRGVERSSGDRVEAPFTHVLRVRRGKVVRLQIFVDRAKAQRAMETAVREVVP
jgi:ketosteroid isomerase-like protein